MIQHSYSYRSHTCCIEVYLALQRARLKPTCLHVKPSGISPSLNPKYPFFLFGRGHCKSLKRLCSCISQEPSRFRTAIISLAIFIMVLTVGTSCSSAHDEDEEVVELLAESIENDVLDSCLNHGVCDHELEVDPWTMVKRKGHQFVVNDKPFYINGFNTYWLMVFAADNSTRDKVTDVFKQASTIGLTVCRTWAFNDGQWRALQKSPSVYDETVFQALDFVISEAKKYKIRLVLSLVNNWDAYGGKSQYVKWGNSSGLNLTSDDDFFTHPTLKSYFKAHIQTILNRVNTVTNVTYKDDPTIFAWELMNEPRCTSDPSGDVLQAWIEEMAMFVKSVDPKHMIEIGLEGFYGPSTPNRVQYNPNTYSQQVGTDFIRNHQVLGIDYASAHMYPDSWVSQTVSSAHYAFVKKWMQSHIDDAETILGMPVVFGEFGISRHTQGYNTSFRNTIYSMVYKTLLNSTKRGGSGAGSFLWQLFPEGTEYMDDGYAEVISKSPSLTNIISLHSTRLMLFNTLCNWKCRWGCRKKKSTDTFLYHDEL